MSRRVPRPRRTVLLVGAAVALLVALVVWAGTGLRTSDPMDPDNPGPTGARAVARVLADQGVEVQVARSAGELADLEVTTGATVLVVNPQDLGARALGDLTRTWRGSRVVVAGAGPGASDALGVAEPARVPLGDGLGAACRDPALAGLLDGLEVEVDQAWAYPTGQGCFRGDDGTVLTQAAPDLVLLGAEQALTNDQVLRADNAALALRLLGGGDRLVWYVPSLLDLDASDGVGVAGLLPRWIVPGLGIALAGAVVLVVWRARRLGPLTTEPLPVVVRAVETVHSLGRLYRRSGDRAHVASALRRAAARRAATRLQLGRRAGPDEVARAVAEHLGREADEVRALLDPGATAPADDRALTTLAADLAALDREVHRP